jgi:hypothetical protein
MTLRQRLFFALLWFLGAVALVGLAALVMAGVLIYHTSRPMFALYVFVMLVELAAFTPRLLQTFASQRISPTGYPLPIR